MTSVNKSLSQISQVLVQNKINRSYQFTSAQLMAKKSIGYKTKVMIPPDISLSKTFVAIIRKKAMFCSQICLFPHVHTPQADM